MKNSKRLRQTLLYLLIILAVIAADQGLKAWTVTNIPLNPGPGEERALLPGIVHLSYIQNRGAAFGMLQNARVGFLLLLGGFCVLVVWALWKDKLTAGWERTLAVLAMAGAISNGIDRAFNPEGFVVDMFELEFMRFAVFNIADLVINASCILFVLLMLLEKEEKKEIKE